MEKIICRDDTEIFESGNFEVVGYDLVWTSQFIDLAGGGHNRVFYNKDEDLFLVYTNNNGYEGVWSCLEDVVEFLAPDDFDNIYKQVAGALNSNQI